MHCVRESYFLSRLYALWFWFLGQLRSGWLYTGAARLSGRLRRLCSGSGILRLLGREGILSRAFSDSAIVSLLQGLINLPARLLHRLYRRFQPLWDGSALLALAHNIAETSYALLSWVLLMLLVTPQALWNNLYSAAALALTLLLFVLAGARKREMKLNLKAMGAYTVAFAAFVLLSFLSSDYRALSARFLVFHITAFLAVLLCVSALDTREKLWRVLAFALTGCLIASLYGIVQRAMGLEVDAKLVDLSVNADMPGRVFSFFENPNSFAMLLVLLLPAALVTALYRRGLWRVLGLVCFVVALAALLMTYSRGAWIGFAFAVCVLVALLRPSLLPLLILAGLAAIPLLPANIYNRLLSVFNGKDTSISSRRPVYQAMGELIRQKPLWGHGLGNDAIAEAVKAAECYHDPSPFIHGHDIYLQIWAEMGVFGLLAFLGAMFSAWKNGARALRQRVKGTALGALIAALIAGFAGVLVCGIVDYPWSYPRLLVLFWFVFGLLLAATRLATGAGEEAQR